MTVGGDLDGASIQSGNLAIGSQDFGNHYDVRRLRVCVVDGRRDMDLCDRNILNIGVHIGSPGAHMDGVCDIEPHMAIDAATFVPPAFRLTGIDEDGENVLAPKICKPVQRVPKSGVTARPTAELMAV